MDLRSSGERVFQVTSRVLVTYLRPVAFTGVIQMLVPQYCMEPGASLELVNIAWRTEKPLVRRVTEEGLPVTTTEIKGRHGSLN